MFQKASKFSTVFPAFYPRFDNTFNHFSVLFVIFLQFSYKYMMQYLLINTFDPGSPLNLFIFSSQNVICGAKNANQGSDTKIFELQWSGCAT